ncbi:hypothetical protein [Prevotella sp. HUN102]|uniref:hypothetical protein n=1 Tax=Prevotella sp. HUN102 TaxID=1392486 RepID=UPI00048D3F89|nr:hypothetical protein [Prevotella sp. HUN102]
MKITNLDKGEAYNLKPGTKIEVERTNPFFNDYGEQTVPLELPASEHNRRLLGFPGSFGSRVKMKPMSVSIQDGDYFATCRQIVLSAQYNGSIATSFYINDGSFYSRIQNVRLKDVFRDEFIPGVSTVEEGIDFCRRLRANTDDKFGIFPVLLADDSGMDTGYNYKVLNAYGRQRTLTLDDILVWRNNRYELVENPQGAAFIPDEDGTGCDFYNATERTEYVNQIPITLGKGYYISPFIRTNYLLRRIFSHFGYTLSENFFDRTEPFSKMVVVNNVIDVLVNGKIRLSDLVPNGTCADFLAVFRKKFCCEFTADEGNRTVEIVFLRDAISAKPREDLTHSMVEEPVITYKSEKDYQRIVIGSSEKVDSDTEGSYEDIAEMAKANPQAYFDPVEGIFIKDGFSGDFLVKTKIGTSSQDYNTGEELEPREIKVPDLIPEFRALEFAENVNGTKSVRRFGRYPYIGSYTSLNSKMLITGKDNEEVSESARKQPCVLAFTYLSDGRPEGTISPYDIHKTIPSKSAEDYRWPHPRIFDYALYYNGRYGIFEKFYRDFDHLLRNSFHDAKVKLLLSQHQKKSIPATAKVIIRNTAFFLDKLKFSLGEENAPVESQLRTVAPMEPVSDAPSLADLLPASSSKCRWVGKQRQTEVSRDEWLNSGTDKDRTFVTVYPPVPTEAMLGEKFGYQKSYTEQQLRHGSFWRHGKWKWTKTEVWLECVR